MKAIAAALFLSIASLAHVRAQENTPPPAKPGPLPTEQFLAQEMERLRQAQPGRPGSGKTSADWRVNWEFQVFALPLKKALVLLPELRDEATQAAAWTKLQAMVEHDEVEPVANNGGQAENGVEAVASQGEDLKYGVEFNAPEAIRVPQPPAPVPPPNEAPKPAEPKKLEPTAVDYRTATFDTRRLGVSLTFKAQPDDDGERLEVTTKFERNWLSKWDETEIGRMPNNDRIVIKQPRFVVVNNQSTSKFAKGERVLLSSYRVPGDAGKMELVFLRVWTTPRKAPVGK